MKLIIIHITLFWSSLALPNAKVVGNGGNEIALDFLKSGKQMLSIYSRELASQPQLKGVNLAALLEKSIILVSNTPLTTTLRGLTQEVTAINFKSPNTIIVNEKRWRAIKADAVKEALVLHELLGLIDIEKTGSYYISKNYLDKNGISCSNDLCESNTSISQNETFCRFQNNWYPNTETSKYRFICTNGNKEFYIFCDLWKDPTEFKGNKIDALGGVWEHRNKVGGLFIYTYPDQGAKYCTYEDTKEIN